MEKQFRKLRIQSWILVLPHFYDLHYNDLITKITGPSLYAAGHSFVVKHVQPIILKGFGSAIPIDKRR